MNLLVTDRDLNIKSCTIECFDLLDSTLLINRNLQEFGNLSDGILQTPTRILTIHLQESRDLLLFSIDQMEYPILPDVDVVLKLSGHGIITDCVLVNNFIGLRSMDLVNQSIFAFVYDQDIVSLVAALKNQRSNLTLRWRIFSSDDRDRFDFGIASQDYSGSVRGSRSEETLNECDINHTTVVVYSCPEEPMNDNQTLTLPEGLKMHRQYCQETGMNAIDKEAIENDRKKRQSICSMNAQDLFSLPSTYEWITVQTSYLQDEIILSLRKERPQTQQTIWTQILKKYKSNIGYLKNFVEFFARKVGFGGKQVTGPLSARQKFVTVIFQTLLSLVDFVSIDKSFDNK